MPRPHWLQPAGKTTTPGVLVTFDTETRESPGDHRTVQTLRCWDAMVRVRHWRVGDPPRPVYCSGETAPQLADVVEEASALDREVWVVAHNVGFDLSVTSLPFLLAERGWSVDGLHLGDESSWWIMKNDDRRLVITDSWSWLRCPLSEAAKDLRRRKVRLPDADDSLDAWHRRCRHDVEILDEAMTTIMDWWEANDLGRFGITGAACGWRALRRQVPERKVLVGPDGDRTAFERQAVFGGRKEVYGVGVFAGTWIGDFDFTAAYATACAAHPLPVTPAKRWCDRDQLLATPLPPQRDYIARVRITTRRPCAPVRIDGSVWWPVGTFTTTLAGPEIRYALDVADEVVVIDWQPYRTGFALADWAAWCIRVQTGQPHEVPAIVQRVAKGWGRSAIGRFAARTSRVIGTRPSTTLGWRLETGHDLNTGMPLEWVTVGGVEQTIAKDIDGPDVFPAVLAFVESHVRVALAHMLDSLPPSDVLQCNTDGWWQMHTPNRSNYVPANVPWPHTITRKAIERRLLVRGPNHVLTPHERRYAGIPRAATSDDGEVMRWHDWPGLRWQLEHGETGQYHRPEREAVLSDHYVRRWVLTTGETVPVTATLDANGDTLIEPWSRSWGRRGTDQLATYQVETLAALQCNDADPDVIPNVILPDQPGRDFDHTPGDVRRRAARAVGRTPVDKRSPLDPLAHYTSS